MRLRSKIPRLWRLFFPEFRVQVREVEGPPLPAKTVVTDDLRDVRFEPETPRVRFEDVTAERVDFSGLRFWSFFAHNCCFLDCDFSHVQAEGLPFGDGGSLFRGCRFDGARIGDFGDVRLERCQFIDADLGGWFTWAADLVECRFVGRLSGVVFNGRDDTGRRKNEFIGNDFRDADLDDVAFRFGIDLDAQLLPHGREYARIRDIRRRVKAARTVVRKWRDEAARADAQRMLKRAASIYEIEPDIFVKRAFLIELADDPKVGERVLELLEQGSARSLG